VALLVAFGIATGCGAPSASRPNLLLVTLDTTRADGLSLLGGSPGATPVLDAFGAEAVVFERAYSDSNVTNPSHLSIMTGVTALRHGVMSNFARIPSGIDTLSQSLERVGYATGGFVSAGPLASAFGWKGFEVMPPVVGVLDAAEVTDRALGWLGTKREEPFFAWVHYWNPHTLYDPPDELFERFYQGDPTDYEGPLIAAAPFFARARNFGVGPRLKRWLGDVRDPAWGRAKYQAEIHYTDRELGRLFDGLTASGAASDTVVVVTADHGESLGEHDIYYAHVGVYDEVLHVPLLIRVPGIASARSRLPVSTLDIAPTIAELLDLELEHEIEGLSLVSALHGTPSPELVGRERFVHTHASNRVVAIRDGRWKLIWPIDLDDRVLSNRVELFDLIDDPAEEHDVAAAHPDVVARLREPLGPWVKHGRSATAGGGQAAPAVDSKIRAQLEALGYSE